MKKILKKIKEIADHLRLSDKRREAKEAVLNETQTVSFDAVTHDWQHAQQLYNELKAKCHPDKFGDELNEKATEIFQSLVENRYNYSELLQIKERATRELGI